MVVTNGLSGQLICANARRNKGSFKKERKRKGRKEKGPRRAKKKWDASGQ